MKTFLITIFVVYIFFTLILFFFQRKFLYFPQTSNVVTGAKEITITTAQNPLYGWIVNEEKNKALIYYGGNAERIEFNIDFFEKNLSEITVYLIPYRGYGKNTGSPTEEIIYKDALHVFDTVVNKHSNIILMGRSLGSGVATYVASKRKVDQLILVTPYDSIENVAKESYWMFPVSLLLKDKYNSMDQVKNINVPTLILIAEHDQVISRKRTENLISNFKKENLEWVLIKQAGHNDISLFPEYAASLKQLLE